MGIRYLNTGDDGPDGVLDELAAVEEWIDQGAPTLAELWAERQGVPRDEHSDRPLTIAQAAEASNLSVSSIRRRRHALAALEPPGAWKVGRVWRIRPDALEALRDVVEAEKVVQRRRRAPAAKPPSSTRWEA